VASRRSRPARLAAALTALLALAGCTAGVPPTGEVVTIGPSASTTPAVDPETAEDGGGPSSGLTESEVALGFLRAMNTARASVIRRWVLPDKPRDTVDGWSRRTTIRVYSAMEPGQPYVRGGRRFVPVKVRLSGQLQDGREWRPATGDHTINLEMGRDGADWRVADPGEVIWMRDVNFERLHAPVEIFMVPGEDGLPGRLAPVPVFVPRGGQTDAAVAGRVEAALRLLLAGPQGRYDHLETAIPPRTRLRRFTYADKVATVDLTRELHRASGAGVLPVGQIVWTVTRILQTAQVRILVEGRQLGAIGDDRFQAGRLWQWRDQQLAGLWPQRSTERASDSVLFVRGGEIFTIDPGIAQSPKPMGLTASGPLSAPTWSPNHRWMAFLVGGGTSQAMWLVQPAGGRPFPVTAAIRGRLSPPSWSPDSQRVYVVSRFQGRSRLWEVTRSSSFTARELGFPDLPSGLQPASVAVSPDGAFVLAAADRPRPDDGTDPAPGGRLFVGQFGPDGVIAWSQPQIAPGLGRVYSPVWVDPLTVAFIAETDTKDDLGKLWVVRSDGWDPTALVNNGTDGGLVADIGHHLTVDPGGEDFVVTVRSSSGASLWTVDRQGRTMRPLTEAEPNKFDTDPSYASR
jgi:hypothetical protein